MTSNNHLPFSSDTIQRDKNGLLQVPDQPIIPFIEGDGIGPDVWRAARAVIDAAVEKASCRSKENRLAGGAGRAKSLRPDRGVAP